MADILDFQLKLFNHYYLRTLRTEIAYVLMRQALKDVQLDDNTYTLEEYSNIEDDEDKLEQVTLSDTEE
jgi:hypothetical protein